MKSLDEKLADAKAKEAEVRKEYEAVERRLHSACDRRAAVECDILMTHADDMAYMINHPNTPGQHKQIRVLMKERYGLDNYEGIYPSMYNSKTMQQCFDVRVTPKNKDVVERVLLDIAPLMKFSDYGVGRFIVFGVRSEDTGLDELAFDGESWLAVRTAWRRSSVREKFASLGDALDWVLRIHEKDED